MSRCFCVSVHSSFELYFGAPFFPAVFLHQFYHSNRWTPLELRHILRKVASTLYPDLSPSRQTWQSLTSAWHLGNFHWGHQQLFKVTWHVACAALWVARVGYKGEVWCLFQPVCPCVVGRVGATEIIEEPPVESRGTDRTLLLSKPHRGLWVQLDPASAPHPVNGLC